MFPNEANIQRQRPQTTTSSFYIRDILRSDSGGLTSSPKFPGYQLPIQPEGTTYYQNGYVSSVPDQISSNPIPCSTVPYSTIYFPSPLSKGVPFDGMIDIRSTDTVPLPVYIRSRSPNGSDSFCRMKKCRRSRTVFTDLQLMGLEKRFESQKYLSTPDRITLAESLGLSQVQVKTWYQNRRMKWKKTVLDECGEQVPIKPKGRPKKEPIGIDSEPAKEPESNMENAQST